MLGRRLGLVALEFLRTKSVILISSGEMGGGKGELSAFNLWIAFSLSLFGVWIGGNLT